MTVVRVAYTYDHRFLLHDTGVDRIRLPSGELLDPEPKPSSVRITRRTAQLVANSGLLDELVQLPARAAARGDLLLAHDRRHVDAVRDLAGRGGGTLGSVAVAPGSWDAAIMAAGTAVALVDAVLDGIVQRAYGLVRPPGHHAGRREAVGYGLFNNAAIAALHARRRGAERVAIVDWDVHHGSGTQEIFWDDPTVLFVSLHQEDWFPAGSGAATDTGGPSAVGTTVNVPLPPGTGDRGYQRAFDRVVLPVLRRFAPDLVVVSAGQDANLRDPSGRMLVTTDGFRDLAAALCAVADERSGGRIVALHEDAFAADYAPFCTLAVMEALVGNRTEVDDPLAGTSELRAARRELRPAVDDAIAATLGALHAQGVVV